MGHLHTCVVRCSAPTLRTLKTVGRPVTKAAAPQCAAATTSLAASLLCPVPAAPQLTSALRLRFPVVLAVAAVAPAAALGCSGCSQTYNYIYVHNLAYIFLLTQLTLPGDSNTSVPRCPLSEMFLFQFDVHTSGVIAAAAAIHSRSVGSWQGRDRRRLPSFRGKWYGQQIFYTESPI